MLVFCAFLKFLNERIKKWLQSERMNTRWQQMTKIQKRHGDNSTFENENVSMEMQHDPVIRNIFIPQQGLMACIYVTDNGLLIEGQVFQT